MFWQQICEFVNEKKVVCRISIGKVISKKCWDVKSRVCLRCMRICGVHVWLNNIHHKEIHTFELSFKYLAQSASDIFSFLLNIWSQDIISELMCNSIKIALTSLYKDIRIIMTSPNELKVPVCSEVVLNHGADSCYEEWIESELFQYGWCVCAMTKGI